jgi:hypothetical protein
MVDPDYAVNFINITTEVIATIVGFLPIFFIFWYENIGKFLPTYYQTKRKEIKFTNFYEFLERKYLIKFTNKEKIKIFQALKFDFIYLKLREKTINKNIIYEYRRVNYYSLFTIALFLTLILLGLQALYYNITVLFALPNFSKEQLSTDQTYGKVLQMIENSFNQLLISVIFFILIVTVQSVQRLSKRFKSLVLSKNN